MGGNNPGGGGGVRLVWGGWKKMGEFSRDLQSDWNKTSMEAKGGNTGQRGNTGVAVTPKSTAKTCHFQKGEGKKRHPAARPG